jgi:hypothetical protein
LARNIGAAETMQPVQNQHFTLLGPKGLDGTAHLVNFERGLSIRQKTKMATDVGPAIRPPLIQRRVQRALHVHPHVLTSNHQESLIPLCKCMIAGTTAFS